jgi:hypothetical protein
MARYQSRWTNVFLRAWGAWLGSDRPPPRGDTRLRVEALEERSVPATITPTTFADGGLGSGSLRDAVLQFNADTGTADDTIQLLPGTYSLTIRNVNGRHETAGLTGDLNLTQTSHRWIIQGAGPSTIIDGSLLQDRVFQIVNPGARVVFQALVIQGGLAQDNGADGAQAGTTDALGGGIFNHGGDLTLDHVVLRDNVARGGDGTGIEGNPGYDARGGGLYATGGTSAISNSTLANNQATGGRGGDGGTQGGTMFVPPGSGGSAQGGGLYTSGGALTIAHSTLANNQATGGDKGFAGLLSADGGSAQGGGLYAAGGFLTFADSTAAANTLRGGDGSPAGASQGGGLYAAGTLTLTNSTITANTLRGGDGVGYGFPEGGIGQGGGLYVGGTATVSNSLIAANTLRGGDGFPGGASQGGGLYVSGTLTIRNSTVAANTLRGGDGSFNPFEGWAGDGGPAQGGGLWVPAGATVRVSFGTIAANQATGGTHGPGRSDGPAAGGGVNNQGTLQTDDAILAGNTVTGPGMNTAPDLAGSLGSHGYNLIANSRGGSGFDPSDLRDVDPLLGRLQYNGGPTQTMDLQRGSPALNAGDPNQLGTADQRGVKRSGGVNIGAYQASATVFLLTAPKTVSSGVPFDVTVKVVDPFGQAAVGYLGTVTFSSSDPDPGVMLPADYAFQLSDAGQVTFPGGVTLITPGDQTLTVTDTADNTLTGSAVVTVSSAAPGAGEHGLDALPSCSETNSAPAQPPTSSEPSGADMRVRDRWLALFPADEVGLTVPGLRHSSRGEMDSWSADHLVRPAQKLREDSDVEVWAAWEV